MADTATTDQPTFDADELEHIVNNRNASVCALRAAAAQIGRRDPAGHLVRATASWRSAMQSGSGAGTSRVLAVMEAKLAAEQAAPVEAETRARLQGAEARDSALAKRTATMLAAQKHGLEVGVEIDETAELLAKLINEFECIGDRLHRHNQECERYSRLDLAVAPPLELLAARLGLHAIQLPAPATWELPGYRPALADDVDRRNRLGRMRELLRVGEKESA